jgi:nucleoredoxin
METSPKLEVQALTSKLTDIMGTTLLSHDGEISTETALKDIDIIGIYFSAQWCGSCKSFTPDLVEKYSKLKEAENKIEIIFCS